MESDFEKYYKSKNISDDLIKLLSDENQDAPALDEYMVNNEYASELKENLCDESRLRANVAKLESYDTRQASMKMVKTIRKRRVNRFILAISTSVAAIMIFSFLIFSGVNDNEIVLQSDVKESATPILILSSGETVNLANVGGEIVVDGCVVMAENNTITTKGNESLKNLKNTLIIPHQYTYTVNLVDGSTVKLNAGGRLSYPVTFDSEQRVVELEEGEAFFTVSKSDKPFIVKTKAGEVRVYGTMFNVRNFENGDVETVLVEGSVGVRHNDSHEVKIKPNQRILFSAEHCVVEDVDVESYVAWTQESFMYNGVALSKVIEDIENWYGVTINIGNLDCEIDLYVDRSATIEKVFKLMEIATNKKFINNGGKNYSIK